MHRLCEKSAAILSRRLGEAEAYLQSLLAGRAGELSYSEAQEVAERLRECEDFITLSAEDWERVCAILCPERFSKSFRRYGAQTLASWGRLCAEVLPEEHAAPARPAAEAPRADAEPSVARPAKGAGGWLPGLDVA